MHISSLADTPETSITAAGPADSDRPLWAATAMAIATGTQPTKDHNVGLAIAGLRIDKRSYHTRNLHNAGCSTQ
jgi:hypothetical protein